MLHKLIHLNKGILPRGRVRYFLIDPETGDCKCAECSYNEVPVRVVGSYLNLDRMFDYIYTGEK